MNELDSSLVSDGAYAYARRALALRLSLSLLALGVLMALGRNQGRIQVDPNPAKGPWRALPVTLRVAQRGNSPCYLIRPDLIVVLWWAGGSWFWRFGLVQPHPIPPTWFRP